MDKRKVNRFIAFSLSAVMTMGLAETPLWGVTQAKAAGKTIVIDDFQSDDAAGNYSNGGAWQYDGDIGISTGEAGGSKALKLSLDYSKDGEYNWSEAKISRKFDKGIDISTGGVLSYVIYYPSSLDGKIKAKVFAKNGNSDTTLIDSEGEIKASDAGNDFKKAVVSVQVKENSEPITELILGTVGVNIDYVGDVFIDDLTFTAADPSLNYKKITVTANNKQKKVSLASMPKTVSLADEKASKSARELEAYLKATVSDSKVIFGHQYDSSKSAFGATEGDSKDLTGSISGIVGLDTLALTGTEIGEKDTSKAIKKCIETSKAAAKEGAIITLSSHMPNFANDKVKKTDKGYDFSECDFNESKDLTAGTAKECLPGGKYNAAFKAYLDIIAKYAKGMGDTPVLFRPFHECDGGWFWWGSATTEPSTFIALYRYMEDYLTNEKDVHNFLYVFSPNGPVEKESTYLSRYPGDSYVDIMGFDFYDDYSENPAKYSDAFIKSLKASCKKVNSIAKKHGKIAAISETGVRVKKADGSDMEGLLTKDNPIAGHDWYNKVNKTAKDAGMAYFLLWANFSDKNFYVPYRYNDELAQELADDFINFYNNKSSVFAKESNFYGKKGAEDVNVKNAPVKEASGYFTNIFDKDVIKKACTIKARVSNAGNSVKLVLTNSENKTQATVTAKVKKGAASFKITESMIKGLGKTDNGTVALYSGENMLATGLYISFGKDKPVLKKNVIDDFDLYYGEDDAINNTYNVNSASGCDSSFSLVKKGVVSGKYAAKFTYTLNTDGPEVWTGRKKSLDQTDYSGCNALSLYMKPDGKGQKVVIQLVSKGEDFEVFLNAFASQKKGGYITIPFSELKGKNGGTFDPSDVTAFAIWCNSLPADKAENLTSSLLIDNVRMGKANVKADKLTDGYLVSEKQIVK